MRVISCNEAAALLSRKPQLDVGKRSVPAWEGWWLKAGAGRRPPCWIGPHCRRTSGRHGRRWSRRSGRRGRRPCRRCRLGWWSGKGGWGKTQATRLARPPATRPAGVGRWRTRGWAPPGRGSAGRTGARWPPGGTANAGRGAGRIGSATGSSWWTGDRGRGPAGKGCWPSRPRWSRAGSGTAGGRATAPPSGRSGRRTRPPAARRGTLGRWAQLRKRPGGVRNCSSGG